MIARHFLFLALILALASTARAREYDAEADLGLVADNPDPAVAARNTDQLTAALNAQWAGGQFKFASGRVGPVLYPIRCAAKQFFFAGTIKSSIRIGGSLYGGGGRAYVMPELEYSPAGNYGGAVTRFTRIDGDKGGPVIRLRGTGFLLDGISIMGRRWTGIGDIKQYTGKRSDACIEVEGRALIATGCHTIRNCLLAEATYGIRAAGGYYDEAGKFIADENHADQTTVEAVAFNGVDSCFRSENLQALGWSFRDIHVDSTQYGGSVVVFDIVRGGNIMASNVMLNHNRVTLIKVSYYSHNTQRISVEDFRFDGAYGKNAYLTLFEYAGQTSPPYDDMSWMKWTVRVTGHIPNSDTDPTYDTSKLIVIPDSKTRVGLNRNDLLFDVARLPRGNFENAGGPWMRPK